LKMGNINKLEGSIIPAFMFFLLYTVIAFSRSYSTDDFQLIIISCVTGIVLGGINSLIATKRKNWHFKYELYVFWGIYIVIQSVSAFLIWSYLRYDIPRDSIWYGLFYWFPQMLYVFYTIPGAFIYQTIGYVVYRRKYLK